MPREKWKLLQIQMLDLSQYGKLETKFDNATELEQMRDAVTTQLKGKSKRTGITKNR